MSKLVRKRMLPYMYKLMKNFDYSMLIVLFWLVLFGLVMVYSASIVTAVILYDYQIDFFYKQQLRSIIIAGTVFIITSFIPYTFYKRLMKLLLLLSIFILIYVLINGKVANNSSQWLTIGPFSIQPSEFVKLSVIIYLATIFAKKQHYITNISKAVAPPVIVLGVILILIGLQPDLGTAMVIAITAYVLIICSGIKVKHIAIVTGFGAICLLTVLLVGATSEQLSRFPAAYQPFNNPSDDGYQLINSYVAFASGGLTGQGFGQSIQKYGYLPEPHTDFIISVIGEEFGFIGVLMVLLLIAFLVIRGLLVGINSEDSFASLLAIGIATLIGTQTFINIGVASGVLPITGVTLPFISFGGSSLLALMIAMGMLMNLSAHHKMERVNRKKNENSNVVPIRPSIDA
jgi:cell division protein FtsW